MMKVMCPICFKKYEIDKGWDSINCPQCGERISTEVAEYYEKANVLSRQDSNEKKVRDYFDKAIMCENMFLDDPLRERAVLFHITTDYSYYLTYKVGEYQKAESLLKQFDGVEDEKNPYVSYTKCQIAFECLSGCMTMQGKGEESYIASERLARTIDMIQDDEGSKYGVKEMIENLLIQSENDIHKGLYEDADTKINKAKELLSSVSDIDEDEYELMGIMADVVYANSVVMCVYDKGLGSQEEINNVVQKLKNVLPKIERNISEKKAEALIPLYIEAENSLGLGMIAQGHLLQGKKYTKNAKKRRKLMIKGKSIF